MRRLRLDIEVAHPTHTNEAYAMHTLHCAFATLSRQDFQAIRVAGEAQEDFPVDCCNALSCAMKLLKDTYEVASCIRIWSIQCAVARRHSPRRREEAPERCGRFRLTSMITFTTLTLLLGKLFNVGRYTK